MREELNPAVFQNRFWLQVMTEHIKFVLLAISPNEVDEIKSAQSLLTLLEGMQARVRRELFGEELKQLNEQAFRVVQNVRKFNLHLLLRQVTDTLELDLLPGVLNRFVNETEEYLNILGAFVKNENFLIPPMRLHFLWLIDGAGHSGIIQDGINASNKLIRDKAYDFERKFLIMHNRALEIGGIFRTGLKYFPAFEQFNEDVAELLTDFTEFFVDLNLKLRAKKIMGSLPPIWLDHMYRENCYYLTELSEVCGIKAPVCDPTSEEYSF